MEQIDLFKWVATLDWAAVIRVLFAVAIFALWQTVKRARKKMERDLAACHADRETEKKERKRDNRHTRAMIQIISESFGVMRSMTGGQHGRAAPQELIDLEAKAKRLLSEVIADNGV